MADEAITDYTAKTDVDGDELLEVVDLKESSTSTQNKKMTTTTLINAIVCYENVVVCYENNVVITS